ncbi:AI-2E family transporter [Defluviitalea raffinosedens]|uniref:AI-2E family transporter n=1 Tax=Defluviitalea raffinosedens TaxID=1450156 RepID=A0A7C8HI06_9FIRM|nr:AI-2E family transporter [Defluviitalea raffinosedens]KAE9636914.1 AI-2E family transporter [Defluviitalea raffinosedens]MBM7685337.1 putative PurR-regulated permease PerM [Defluviitalea raffinosedens]
MKLPWDKNYLKISFHVIFTLLVIYGIAIIIQNIIPISACLGLIISKIFSILSPFFLGVVIAYLLDPLVELYQKNLVDPLNLKYSNKKKFPKKINSKDYNKKANTRTISTLLTYITVISIILLVLLLFSSSIGNKKSFRNVDNLVDIIRAYTQSFNNMVYNIQQKLDSIGFLQETEETIQELSGKLGNIVQSITTKVIEGITKAGNHVVNFAMAMVIAFYLLKDKAGFINLMNRLLKIILPERILKSGERLWKDIDYVLSGYIRGQLTDSLIMGILIGVSVAIIGIDFPIIIGIIAGIANVIPYFGPIIGMIPAALMGLISDNPMKALYAVITLLILQQIDGAIIAPKIVGESVDVHPVAIVVALAVGGSLFGILGMLLAVPAAAFLKLLLVRYMDSRSNV